MTDMTDIQTQATITEIEQQRNWALTRCASLAAAVTVLRAEVDRLTAELAKQPVKKASKRA